MYASLPDYANAEVMRQHQLQHQRQHHQGQPPSHQRHRDHIVEKAAKQSPPSVSSRGSTSDSGGDDELDERAGRFASALLLLAALVLAVDASRVALYSWYSEGTFLQYTYGGRSSVDWPRCGAAAAATAASAPPPQLAAEPLRRMARSVVGPTTADDAASSADWLADAKRSVMAGVRLAGEALNAGLLRPLPRPPPKPLAVALCHASAAACIGLLLTAILPACLRSSRPSRCVLSAAVALAVASVGLAALAVSACIVKIYFFTLCEIAPPRTPPPAYDFVPPCPLLRKAFFCAECFSLLVLIAAACMAVCLLAFFSRALLCCCCCCRDSVASERRRRRMRPQPRPGCYGDSRGYPHGFDDGYDDFPV